MTKADFEQMAQYILQYNDCFVRGFANAYKDNATNTVWVKDGTDLKCLLPADVYGGYFYLRNDTTIKHEALPQERVTDSGTQRLVFLDSITLYLVAIVKDADEFQLIEDLRNTCMSYDSMNVVPVSSNWNAEQVLAEELAKMKQEDIQAALQRLKNETIIKLTLNVTKPFVPNDCITKP